MKISNLNVKELEKEELVLISGGDRITRAFFHFFGRLFGHINNMMEAEAQHGATGAW